MKLDFQILPSLQKRMDFPGSSAYLYKLADAYNHGGTFTHKTGKAYPGALRLGLKG
jgi:hypothetical protein